MSGKIIKDRLRTIVFGEGIIISAAWLYYDDFFWIIPLQILLLPLHLVVKKKLKEYRKVQYIQGFQEVLQSLMTSLQAGYSLENACKDASREVRALYRSDKNPTMIQLNKIVRGIELHRPVEELFMVYAQETEVDEIYEFATVLHIARSTGGNIVEILKNAMEHLQCKLDALSELQVNLSGRIFEKNIMLIMPCGMLLYLRLANPEYVSGLYRSFEGNFVMTGVIVVTIFCFFWTERIMDIEF